MVELADAAAEQLQDFVGCRSRIENDVAKDGRRHDAQFRAGQRRHIGRALDAVDCREFAEEFSGTHLSQDDFLAGGGADKHPDLAGNDEIDVGALVFVIDDRLAVVETAPQTAALELLEIEIGNVFEEGNPGKKILHGLPCHPARAPQVSTRPAPGRKADSISN